MASDNSIENPFSNLLIEIVKKAIKDAVMHIYEPPIEKIKIKECSKRKGVFVTITKNKMLRGCIGSIIPEKELCLEVYDNAIRAALYDPRFPPLNKEELREVEAEITILSELKKLEYKNWRDLLEKIEVGKHGVVIKFGSRSATFLPQVWEILDKKELFLEELCKKAGLDKECWKTNKLEVYIYYAEKIIGPFKVS